MNDFTQIVLPLLTAMALGGLIGLERGIRRHPAGLRTHALASTGAAVFVLAVATDSNADVSRVLQGVATGVGFIGAGTILQLRDRRQVIGLTTAASIWLAAAIGVAAALQRYSLAVTASVGAFVVLELLGYLERRFPWISASPDEKSVGQDSNPISCPTDEGPHG